MQVMWAIVQGWGLARFQTAKVSQDIWSPAENMARIFLFSQRIQQPYYSGLTVGSVSCTLIPHGLLTSEELDIGSSTLRWFGTSTFGAWHRECQQCPQCREPTTEVLQESVGAVDISSLLTTFWAFFPFSHCCTSQRFTSHREFLGFFWWRSNHRKSRKDADLVVDSATCSAVASTVDSEDVVQLLEMMKVHGVSMKKISVKYQLNEMGGGGDFGPTHPMAQNGGILPATRCRCLYIAAYNTGPWWAMGSCFGLLGYDLDWWYPGSGTSWVQEAWPELSMIHLMLRACVSRSCRPCLSIYPSIYLSTYLSIYLSIYLIYLCIYQIIRSCFKTGAILSCIKLGLQSPQVAGSMTAALASACERGQQWAQACKSFAHADAAEAEMSWNAQ